MTVFVLDNNRINQLFYYFLSKRSWRSPVLCTPGVIWPWRFGGDPQCRDLRPRDLRPATHDPKTCDTKEAGVREASSQEAKDQKAHETSQGISKHNESSRRLYLSTGLGLGLERTVWQIISNRGKHNGPFEGVVRMFFDFRTGRLSDTCAFENSTCKCLRPSCAFKL